MIIFGSARLQTLPSSALHTTTSTSTGKSRVSSSSSLRQPIDRLRAPFSFLPPADARNLRLPAGLMRLMYPYGRPTLGDEFNSPSLPYLTRLSEARKNCGASGRNTFFQNEQNTSSEGKSVVARYTRRQSTLKPFSQSIKPSLGDEEMLDSLHKGEGVRVRRLFFFFLPLFTYIFIVFFPKKESVRVVREAKKNTWTVINETANY